MGKLSEYGYTNMGSEYINSQAYKNLCARRNDSEIMKRYGSELFGIIEWIVEEKVHEWTSRT